MVKVYLDLCGEVVQLELDVHELCHKLDIRHGHFKETARNIVAPQEAIDLFELVFEKPFECTCRCFPTSKNSWLWMYSLKRRRRRIEGEKGRWCFWIEDHKCFFMFCEGGPPAEWGHILDFQSLSN